MVSDLEEFDKSLWKWLKSLNLPQIPRFIWAIELKRKRRIDGISRKATFKEIILDNGFSKTF